MIYIVIIVLILCFVVANKMDNMSKPYWRVTYKDGKTTRLLYYREAKSLAEVFNGKLWYDIKESEKIK